jgi:hypothetical protein
MLDVFVIDILASDLFRVDAHESAVAIQYRMDFG